LSQTNGQPLLEVRDLRVWFPIHRGLLSRTVGYVKAVDGVSLDIGSGRTLGLVGESGCGKTTVGRAILRLIRPGGGAVLEGNVKFRGQDFFAYRGSELRRLRKHMQIVFQDPIGSLNPRLTIGGILGELLAVHDIAPPAQRPRMIASLLERVGLDPSYARRYPHEFSGGQRQRIGIARALALSPDFIVCDEPVSALDVSIQAQVINLLEDLQQQLGLTYLFIAHDLSVVRHISTRVAVMYVGKIVELAGRDELYARPLHPYTQALLSAIPIPDPAVERRRKRIVLTGDIPSPVNPPSGCRFHTRCPVAFDRCLTEDPPFKSYGTGHLTACHWVDEHGGRAPDLASLPGASSLP